MKPSNKIGILIDGYRVGLQQGLILAKEAGAEGVQFFVGDDPEEDIRQAVRFLRASSRSE